MCAFMRMTERFHQSHSIPGVPRLAHHRESRSARNVGLKRVGNICCDHVVIKSSKTLRLSLRLISVSLTWLEFCVGRCWKMLEDVGRSQSNLYNASMLHPGLAGCKSRLFSTFQNITICQPKVATNR